VDDFALFRVSYDETLKLKNVTFDLLTRLGLKINPTKGHFIPILIGEHLGIITDMKESQFVAPTANAKQIAVLAKTLLYRAAAHKRRVSVKTLASLAGKAQILHLTIPVVKFFLRELHDVSSSAK
jgi:hypothetical protein